MLFEVGLIVDGAILAAAIGMADQTRRWTPSVQGHSQGAQSKVHFQSIADGPADNAPCVEVNDDGKIQTAFCGPDVGDIRRPFQVGSISREVLIQQFRRNGLGMLGIGCPLEAAPLPGDQIILTYQSRDAAAADGMAVGLQIVRHTGTAIGSGG